jgi:hypothetical protein
MLSSLKPKAIVIRESKVVHHFRQCLQKALKAGGNIVVISPAT